MSRPSWKNWFELKKKAILTTKRNLTQLFLEAFLLNFSLITDFYDLNWAESDFDASASCLVRLVFTKSVVWRFFYLLDFGCTYLHCFHVKSLISGTSHLLENDCRRFYVKIQIGAVMFPWLFNRRFFLNYTEKIYIEKSDIVSVFTGFLKAFPSRNEHFQWFHEILSHSILKPNFPSTFLDFWWIFTENSPTLVISRKIRNILLP